MNVHKQHGPKMAAKISAAGTRLIEQAGVIFDAAYQGRELSNEGHALVIAEEAARKVVEAIAAYRRAAADDPVITWERPTYHRQAEGLRCEDVLPDDGIDPGQPASDRDLEMVSRYRTRGDRTIPLATLAALNGDDPEAA